MRRSFMYGADADHMVIAVPMGDAAPVVRGEVTAGAGRVREDTIWARKDAVAGQIAADERRRLADAR